MAGNSAAGAVSRQALAGALSEDDSRRLRMASYMDPVPLLRPYSMRSFTRSGAEQGTAVPLPRKLAEAVASDPGVIEVPDLPELPRGELEHVMTLIQGHWSKVKVNIHIMVKT